MAKYVLPVADLDSYEVELLKTSALNYKDAEERFLRLIGDRFLEGDVYSSFEDLDESTNLLIGDIVDIEELM